MVLDLRDGLVKAALSMNDKESNEAGGKLIESRRVIDEKALADPGVELAELIPSAAF